MYVITKDVIKSYYDGIIACENPSNVKHLLLKGKDNYKTKERWNYSVIF